MKRGITLRGRQLLFALTICLAAPLLAILQQALQDAEGRWVGFANFANYLRTPALLRPPVTLN